MFFRLVEACVTLLVLLSLSYGGDKKHNTTPLPSQGVVPDEITAVKIGEAVFPPIFGEEEVSRYRPYHAMLKDSVWTVYGTLKPNARGGTPMMTIQKSDGKVIEIWHSQ
jgi:NTF2 fold immunity protein